MIISEPFDGWGNKVLQQCFARVLSEKTGYKVKAPKIPWLVSSGDYTPANYKPSTDTSKEVFVSHKSANRHKVDITELMSHMPCKYRIHSYLEYYPNLEPYHDQIVSDWVRLQQPKDSPTGQDMTSMRGRFKTRVNGKFVKHEVNNITNDDLVLSIRLGRDYLGQHKYRLLLGDYFKIVLDNINYNRLFITSQDPYNSVLSDLYEYDPIFVDHVTPVHTLHFVKQFNNIAISQSTYSWWAAYLSSATRVFFPITKDGPWSYGPHQRDKWKSFQHDLMVPQDRYTYVSYKDRKLLGCYKKTRELLKLNL